MGERDRLRAVLLKRIELAQGGIVNWCTTQGIEDSEAAHAWLALSTERRWGRGPAETRLLQKVVASHPELLGLSQDEMVELVDLGCGDGYKGGTAAAALAAWGVERLHYIAVDGGDVLVNHAASFARSMVSGLYSEGIVTDFTRRLILPIQQNTQRVFLFLGNTINTFEVRDIVPALAALIGPDDLLIIGARYLRARLDRCLPPVNEATTDLDRYPAEIGSLLHGYYEFNIHYPVYKALIAGLHDDQFDHHVVFDPHDCRIRRYMSIRNIEAGSELASQGFRNGQRILFSMTRYEPLPTQVGYLTRCFNLMGIQRSEGMRPGDNNVLLILRPKEYRALP